MIAQKRTPPEGSILYLLQSDKSFFKDGCDPKELNFACDNICRIAIYYWSFCQEKNIHGHISSILKKQAWSKSDVHPEGRGLDLHSKSWTKELKDEFISVINRIFYRCGAVSFSDGKRRVIILECDGTDNEHFHCQTAKNQE